MKIVYLKDYKDNKEGDRSEIPILDFIFLKRDGFVKRDESPEEIIEVKTKKNKKEKKK
jgi:hypothetical protein